MNRQDKGIMEFPDKSNFFYFRLFPELANRMV
jgi:hypothetical protein